MNSTIVQPQKMSESAEVREYALAQLLLGSPKKTKLKDAIDLVARVALFFVLWSLATDFAVYVWRLLTCC
jgi:hypothetical protein